MKSKYKLYRLEDNDNVFYIGKIPLHIYLHHLRDKRAFSKEMAVEYTKRVYGLDISEIIGGYRFYFDYNPYLEEEKSRVKSDDGTRSYFNAYGRRFFIKFINKYIQVYADNDALLCMGDYSVIHHIHPLDCGGNNSLINLIQINDFSHELLHMNPYEMDEDACHKAVDYLSYLYSFEKFNEIYDEYKLENYKEKPNFAKEALQIIVRDEMKSFYKNLI